MAKDRSKKSHAAERQSRGRRENAALPLGEREGGDTPDKVKAVGRRERGAAGPDGPDAKAVGDTFKAPPPAH